MHSCKQPLATPPSASTTYPPGCGIPTRQYPALCAMPSHLVAPVSTGSVQVQRCSFVTAQGQRFDDVAVKTAVGRDAAELVAAEESLTGEAQAICHVRSHCGCAGGCRHVPPLLAVVPAPPDPPAPRAHSATALAHALILPAYPTCLYDYLKTAKAAHKASGRVGPILPMHQRLRILLHIVRALACAERARMAHCDVKPSNIMFDAAGSAVLIDWGLATPHGEYCQGAFGTSAYVPPEMLDPAGFCARSSLDIWSVGVLCLEMIRRRRLTSGLEREEVYALLQAGQLYTHEIHQLTVNPQAMHCEPEWATIILLCLQPNPRKRASLRHLEDTTAVQLMALESHLCRGVSSALCDAQHAQHTPTHRGRDGPGGSESSLDGSFMGSYTPWRDPAAHSPPAPVTAAAVAASAVKVLRLVSMDSCATFSHLHADADHKVPSGVVAEPPFAAPQGPAAAAAGHTPPPPDAGRGSSHRCAAPLGPRAASTPAPLADHARMFSCELESFDRFTDRPPPLPANRFAAAQPLFPAPPQHPTDSPTHASQSAPGQPSCIAAPDSVPYSSTSGGLLASSGPFAASTMAEHRHPFGRSPPGSPMPFGMDPVITAPGPDASMLQPGLYTGAIGMELPHVDLPRVRTRCNTAQTLPEIDEIAAVDLSERSPASSGAVGVAGTSASAGRARDMTFSKLGAHTPAGAPTPHPPLIRQLEHLCGEHALDSARAEDVEPGLKRRTSAAGALLEHGVQCGPHASSSSQGSGGCGGFRKQLGGCMHDTATMLHALGQSTPCSGDDRRTSYGPHSPGFAAEASEETWVRPSACGRASLHAECSATLSNLATMPAGPYGRINTAPLHPRDPDAWR